MKMTKKIGRNILLERFYYEPLTGDVVWGSGRKAGTIATTKTKNGYLEICTYVDKKRYRIYAHRFAFLYMTGEIPKQVDHDDRNRLNNVWSNIESSSNRENSKNKKRYSSNTSGVCGVTWNKASKKWQGQIKVDYKNINLGLYAEFSDAVNARKNAEVLYGFHKNHGT